MRVADATTPARARFWRHVAVLISWTVVAQAISLGAMLILPRLFQPEQFGVFSVFSGVVVMLGIVAALRYEFAIGLPRDDADAAALFTLCVALAALSFMLWLAAASLLPLANLLPGLAALSPWWGLVALGAACIGWTNAATYMALRSGRFAAVGWAKALVALVAALGQIGAGVFLSRGDDALILPFLVAQLAGSLFLLWALKGQRLWHFDRATLREVAARYAKFPKYIAPGSLLDGFAVLLPVATIAAMYSPAQAGIYALAERALRVPVTLIGSSVLQVFYRRAAELRGNEGAARRLLLRTWSRLGSLAFLPCVLIGLFGESIFAMVFGAAWRDSGVLAQIMAIATFFFFISYPTSNILVVNERTRSFLFWQAAQLLLVGGALWWITVDTLPPLVEAVAWLVAAQATVYLLSMLLQWQAVATTETRLAEDIAAGSGGGA